jgi:hypothetical protein
MQVLLHSLLSLSPMGTLLVCAPSHAAALRVCIFQPSQFGVNRKERELSNFRLNRTSCARARLSGCS